MIFESTTSGNKAKLNLQRTIYPRPCPSSNARSAYYIEMMRAATRFSTFPAKLPSDENRYFATERTFDITIHSMFYHGIFVSVKEKFESELASEMTLRKFDVEFRKGRRNIASWMHPVAERWKWIHRRNRAWVDSNYDLNFPPLYFISSFLENLSIVLHPVKKSIVKYLGKIANILLPSFERSTVSSVVERRISEISIEEIFKSPRGIDSPCMEHGLEAEAEVASI